ncbi:MAG: pantetheine-phosphate adenylyltransferase [Thaumarchaeota archaeon]|nr:pantetheine-phosphate adenylyltransferase [Nitrososphaerota archaeon]MBI3640994.1 pantetheine-phosphate adenylyltransferase [Nitrososphaerota archaeon]
MAKFHLVALGGTFDILHKGHFVLLQKGFSISSKVIIGLTSDELATKKGKNLLHNYFQRYQTLESMIKKNFPNSQFEISKLDNDFGPAVLEKEVEALVVSEETTGQGHILNKLRNERQLSPVEIVNVPMVLATDGKRISTSRIKDSEIDAEGNLR